MSARTPGTGARRVSRKAATRPRYARGRTWRRKQSRLPSTPPEGYGRGGVSRGGDAPDTGGRSGEGTRRANGRISRMEAGDEASRARAESFAESRDAQANVFAQVQEQAGGFFSGLKSLVDNLGRGLSTFADAFKGSGLPGALKGAGAGTAVLPGIGTAIGAGLGWAMTRDEDAPSFSDAMSALGEVSVESGQAAPASQKGAAAPASAKPSDRPSAPDPSGWGREIGVDQLRVPTAVLAQAVAKAKPEGVYEKAKKAAGKRTPAKKTTEQRAAPTTAAPGSGASFLAAAQRDLQRGRTGGLARLGAY